MGKHILQLHFPDKTNEGVFLIKDISIYDGDVLATVAGSGGAVSPLSAPPVSGGPSVLSGIAALSNPINCANLQITPPGFFTPTSLNVEAGFYLILNSCMIGLSPANACGTDCPALPDGLYNIRYSVAPNDKVFVEYKILRIVKALNCYYKLLCKVGLSPCLPDKEVGYQLRELDMIYDYLMAAKVMVENEHQFSDGMNLYRFAITCMDKMSFYPKNC